MNACLCAVDFTDSSTRSLQTAKEVALQYGASLIVFHSYRLLTGQSGEAVQAWRDQVEARATTNFAEMTPFLSESQLSYRFITHIGFMADGIGAIHRKNKIGLLVIGQELARDTYEHEHQFDDFMKKVGIPVLIVP